MQTKESKGFLLSLEQVRLWSLLQENNVYYSQCAVLLQGTLDLIMFQQVFQQVVDRHEILRTVFRAIPGMDVPVQVVTDKSDLVCLEYDSANLTLEDSAEQIHTLFSTLRAKSSDITHAPLLHALLLRLSAQQHILLVSAPALCADASTLKFLISEVSLAYAAYQQQSDYNDDEPLQYADVATWQNELLQDESAVEQRAYWKKMISPALDMPSLPFDPFSIGRGEDQLSEGQPGEEFVPGVLEIPFEAAHSEQIHLLAQRYGISLTAFWLACWMLLLWRMDKDASRVIGVSCDGRHYDELASALGPYTHIVPFSANIAEHQTFIEAAKQIQQILESAVGWQEYFSWEQLSGAVEAMQGPAYLPISFEYEQWPTNVSAGGVNYSLLQCYSCNERFVLKLNTLQKGNAFSLALHYDQRRLSYKQTQLISRYLQTLVEHVLQQPEARVTNLELLDRAEQQRLLQEFRSSAAYPEKLLIQQLFEEQVEHNRNEIAVMANGEQLTYEQFNIRANQLAHWLRRQGIGPDMPVGLCVSRSLDMIVGLLGILKAGGTYVPLDPDAPKSRIAYQLDDTGMSLLLTQENLQARLPDWNGQIFFLDHWAEVLADEPGSNPPAVAQPEHLAYVIYTSGSTGVPKGVAIKQQSLVNYTYFMRQQIAQEEGLHFATVSTLAADLGNTMIFCSLTSGGCLHILDYETVTSGEQFARYTAQWPIDVLKIVPSHLQALLIGADGRNILPRKYLILGGEVFPVALLRQICSLGASCAVMNHYGPTETTIGVLVNPLGVLHENEGLLRHDVEITTVPLGRPIANTEVYILDQYLHIVPVGVVGELYIGGVGVAAGYVNQPELTQKHFIAHPFSAEEKARLYRTGDFARYRADGTIEFVGRQDAQVKLRGHRIELGEVESILRQHPKVQETIVMLRKIADDARMIAYVICQQHPEPSSDELRRFMLERLPEPMIPSSFVLLRSFPLTANGKVDRQQLPLPEQGNIVTTDRQAEARGPIEEILVEIWRDVLHLDKVGIYDNFFALGGHSLLATQIVSRLRSILQVEIPILALFEVPTIAGLAEQVEKALRNEPKVEGVQIKPVAREERLPLSFAQQRLWFIDQLEPDSSSYNIPVALQLAGELDVNALRRSLGEIILRHETLRTTFSALSGQPFQLVHPDGDDSLQLVDLRGLYPDGRMPAVRSLIYEEALRPFDLAHGPLLRALLIQLAVDVHILVLTMHHIAADGWSKGIFVQELTALYVSFKEGRPAALPELPVQYVDFALWQRQWLQGDVLQRQLSYWKKQLAGISTLNLPTDYSRSQAGTSHALLYELAFPKDLSEELKKLSRRQGVTLFMVLVAALQTLLYRYSGQEDISTGSPIANRNRGEIEGLIGFFVNMLVLRTDLSGDPAFTALLERVREVTLGAYAHQDLPFEKLVEELQPERRMNQNPLFQVSFALQNAPISTLELPDLTVSYLPIEESVARFDIEMHLWETHDGLRGRLIYNTDLFAPATIKRMMTHFENLLQSIVQNPTQRLSALRLLTEAEQKILLQGGNKASATYPVKQPLHVLFEQQVREQPDAVALVFEDKQLTYGELDRRATKLAHYLRQLGVQPDGLVGICMERCLEMVVGILSILKAGAAYVPLDPAYPKDRLIYILEDSRVPVVLTLQSLQEQVALDGLQTICLDTWPLPAISDQETPHLPVVSPDNLAYVIYTSGSTGRPKGVLVSHANVVRLFSATQEQFNFSEKDVWSLFHSFAFDFSVWELWGALLYGGRLVVVPYWISRAPDLFYTLLLEEQVTVLNQTPSAFYQLQKVESRELELNLRFVIFGGEALELHMLQSWFLRHNDLSPQLVNMYGITETTVHVTFYSLTQGDLSTRAGSVIGVPLSDLEVYILDQHQQLLPAGVPGEVYVGGDGLARGYLNRSDLTSERFIAHPFSKQAGARLYRTGDLARYLADGMLEYIGRIDQQVKIRGHRIELGEIEAVLNLHPAVKESVVNVRTDQIGDKRLIAYIVPDHNYQPVETLTDEWKQEYISQWKMLYEETYRDTSILSDPTFNIIGWNSSYTGKPIAPAEMQEQIGQTVERILALHPTSVFEIGCGTGLLLFRVAPSCLSYRASDFSSEALRYVERLLPSQQLTQVTLDQRLAHDFSSIAEESFDVIVLNSIVQYFPDIDYTLQTLTGALRTLKPGGSIFIGDLRSYPLLKAYAASVEFFQAAPSCTKEELRQHVHKHIYEEEELLIDPQFFTDIRGYLPQITDVRIQLRRGHAHNELTRFRYDVILSKGVAEDEQGKGDVLYWHSQALQERSIEQILQETNVDSVQFKHVPNARLRTEAQVLSWLSSEDGPATVVALKEVLKEQDEIRVDPEELWSLGERLGYTVEVSWSESGSVTDCDVRFKRIPAAATPPRIIDTSLVAETNKLQQRSWKSYANNPLQGKMSRKVIPQLRESLKKQLPEYMQPSAFVTLERIPLTHNGKIDRRALPEPDAARPEMNSEFVAPRNPVEEVLASIWCDLLDLKKVGIHDNFFELGGHSLLATQVISRIRSTLQVEISLRSLFETPTIASLASLIIQTPVTDKADEDILAQLLSELE
ncbi:MAG TPA: amino acid adenylation domain-containing protein [Ktedonobacteraceae bacterium]|nr:amino acid adenylation domain-containing protein [Ktedonobacteraceae bacterium]